jgi:YesN/AraC family two-component response regulator
MKTHWTVSPYSGETDISILCVEDEPITREFLRTIVSLYYPAQKVHVAENGKAGLALFRELGADVVLTDISMPIMDGVRMAREILLLDPDTCIIAMSAHNSQDCLPDEGDRLFTRYIQKPVSTKLLCETIDECIVLVSGREL